MPKVKIVTSHQTNIADAQEISGPVFKGSEQVEEVLSELRHLRDEIGHLHEVDQRSKDIAVTELRKAEVEVARGAADKPSSIKGHLDTAAETLKAASGTAGAVVSAIDAIGKLGARIFALSW